jgi:ubiquitin carboxyl-terminal hydrolase 14
LLGRNAVWKKTLRINRLPKYLCVQFMRFYWKATPESRDHTGVKCKMLRVCLGSTCLFSESTAL